MELDSDYCSNDSDGTPTPPLPTQKQPDPRSSNLNNGRNGENSFVFVVGNQKERIDIKEKDLVTLCKSTPMISRLVISSKKAPMHEIQVPGWDTDSFKIFLKFTLTGEIKAEDLKDFGEIIRLCVKHNIQKLLGQVSSIARQSISLENCVEIYYIGATFDIDELRIPTYGYFLRMGNAFLEHPKFLDLDCVTLSLLAASDDFAVYEITLFKRIREWVIAQCKQLGYPPDRKEFFGRVAGLLFRHVRYVQMPQKEFEAEVVPSGLLSEKDIEGINLRYKTQPGLWCTLPPHPFVDAPRLVKVQSSVPLYHNSQVGFRRIGGASSTIQESVRFMVSHDIYVTSIGFFGPAKGDRCTNGSPPTTFAIRIHIEGDYSKYHSRCPSQNATVIIRDNFTVDLSNPYQIQSRQPYKLTVWIDGDVTQFGVVPHNTMTFVRPDTGELISFHFGDADNDPQPNLETGRPSSSAPVLLHQNYPNKLPFRQEPRSSGVIRCINFVIKE